MSRLLSSQVQDGGYRSALVAALALHVVVLAVATFGLDWFWSPLEFELGSGAGGGRGEFISVGLAADLGGGSGMIKPPVTPRAESAPPVEKKETAEPETENTFSQLPEPKPETPPPAPSRRRPPREEKEPKQTKPGLIPRESDPGMGARGGGGGSGGGFGSGRGLAIGSGTGEAGQIESWYIRQVEQRVGQNWLQTSLGRMEKVQVEATFVVQPNGRITDVRLEKSSGVAAVDLAVLRAIQASDPLPPLPVELRHRSVRFRAVFEYPQE
ncbi:MAG TPA: TonB family protein [Acidobacteriota bacterium]|nr:TonB family protein [Acidobacteriota bacterium]